MDKEKPIIWLIDSLGPGGAEQLMPAMMKRFRDVGFNIRVCVLQTRAGNPIAADLKRIGLPVDLIPVPNLRHPLNLFRILRYFGFHRPQLVHTQLEFSDILGTLAARILGIPSVSTIHILDKSAEKKSKVMRLKLRWFMLEKFCSRIIAVSEKTRSHHLKTGGLDPKKVITVYNGIDISRFTETKEFDIKKTKQVLHLPLDNRIIITVAVLREPKGIQYMIQALPKILEQIPDIHYLVVGDGAYGTILKDLSASLSVQDHITFAGHRTDIPNLLACSDIFVLPTLGDALPTVLIEALAAGKPIVASNVGGVPEIIENGVNGVLVPPGDPSRLADACLQLLKNKKQARQMILAGGQTVWQRFNVDAQIEQLSKIYEELVASHGK